MGKKGKTFVDEKGREYIAFKLPDGNIIMVPDPDAYQEITDMPDPVVVDFGVRIYNYTASTLWFTAEITSYPDSWTPAAELELGSIGTGSNKWKRLKELGSRDRPVSAVDDAITIMMRAYSDSGYTTEVGGGYPVIITYHWIDESEWLLQDEDNFDTNASLEGWTDGFGGWDPIHLVGDYVLSSPNSAYVCAPETFSFPSDPWFTRYITKEFTHPSGSEALLIMNVKWRARGWNWVNNREIALLRFWITEDGVTKLTVGIGDEKNDPLRLLYFYGSVGENVSNWYRMVVPVSADGASHTIRLYIRTYQFGPTSSDFAEIGQWIDDIKLIYKA